ncbi:MAG: erythromycin biosynthesis sensory transduction protein eryC1 [Deltaproteobacteria bacterium RBG_16_48_10]|nr:MAG: erythromycin biosynthesis sensory transduction protein eryC1 [Deltaproteobacteria bacterium RBG_16_48_10]
MVPFNDLKRQYQGIEKEILAATKRVYEKGRYILGEEVSAFEKEFARYCGVRYGVGVGSGTEALYLSLKASGIGEGDEVITSANSFISTAFAISFTGAKPLFVDIDYQTYTMDPDGLELLLKRRMAREGWERVKAVLPVHLYGHPAEMGSILEIANRYNLLVIEDACQAHGAKYGEKKVGSFGAFGCFSFYPTKNLGGYGDGGMVVTNHQRFYEKLRLLRCYGEKRKYEHHLKGGNSRLDELQAALLRVKLKYLDQWNEERKKKANFYSERLASLGVVCPLERKAARHVYHLYVIRTRKRDSLQAFLKKRGVDTLIHYPIPIHQQKAFGELGYQRGDLPLTEQVSRKILSLPFFPEIKESEIEEVVKGIRGFVDKIALPSRLPAGRQARPSKRREESD